MKFKTLALSAFALSLTPCFAEIGTKPVAKGFERPVWGGVPEGVDGKLWVMEQAGKVWIVDLKTGERGKEPSAASARPSSKTKTIF